MKKFIMMCACFAAIAQLAGQSLSDFPKHSERTTLNPEMK